MITVVDYKLNNLRSIENTLRRLGKWKAFRGRYGLQAETKRAIVTLEEGQRIDVTTGL